MRWIDAGHRQGRRHSSLRVFLRSQELRRRRQSCFGLRPDLPEGVRQGGLGHSAAELELRFLLQQVDDRRHGRFCIGPDRAERLRGFFGDILVIEQGNGRGNFRLRAGAEPAHRRDDRFLNLEVFVVEELLQRGQGGLGIRADRTETCRGSCAAIGFHRAQQVAERRDRRPGFRAEFTQRVGCSPRGRSCCRRRAILRVRGWPWGPSSPGSSPRPSEPIRPWP